MAGLRGRPLPEVRPRDVDGFARAAAAGLVPRVPPDPPRVLPGATAQQVFRTFLLKSGMTVAVVLVLIEVVQHVGMPTVVSGLSVPVLGLLAVGTIFFRFWGDVGRRSVQEFERGYTTFVMQYGGFWWGEGRRWQGAGRRAPWDYSGLWVLDGGGQRMISAPDPNADPPGFYPSPNRRGAFELWTGVVWSGRYRRDPSLDGRNSSPGS
jgi:hypothetical protein